MSVGGGGGEERLASYLSSPLLKKEATEDIHLPVFSLNGSSLWMSPGKGKAYFFQKRQKFHLEVPANSLNLHLFWIQAPLRGLVTVHVEADAPCLLPYGSIGSMWLFVNYIETWNTSWGALSPGSMRQINHSPSVGRMEKNVCPLDSVTSYSTCKDLNLAK